MGDGFGPCLWGIALIALTELGSLVHSGLWDYPLPYKWRKGTERQQTFLSVAAAAAAAALNSIFVTLGVVLVNVGTSVLWCMCGGQRAAFSLTRDVRIELMPLSLFGKYFILSH